jgi:hypothetical protein
MPLPPSVSCGRVSGSTFALRTNTLPKMDGRALLAQFVPKLRHLIVSTPPRRSQAATIGEALKMWCGRR